MGWLVSLTVVSGHCAVITRGLKTLKNPVLLQASDGYKIYKVSRSSEHLIFNFPPLETQIFRSQVKSVRSLRWWRKAQDTRCVRCHVSRLTCHVSVCCYYSIVISCNIKLVS